MEKVEANVHIILLNYNGYKDTIDCVNSLSNIDYSNYKIVIVDNNSTDNSEQEILKYILGNDKVHYIQTGENLGFSGGNNIGIRWSLQNGADYICLLNNDTTVEPNFLINLVIEMEKDQSIGISAGKIMYFNNPDIIWSAGGNISDIKALGCHYGMDQSDNNKEFDRTKKVTFLTGCLQLIRRSVFEDIGLYDHEYFLYMEDVDFCKRTTRAGYKLLYVPKSKIYHKVSASTGGDESPLQLYYMTRNRILFNKKNSNSLLNSIMFYLFLSIKMIIEPFRKKQKYKYMVVGIKDAINGKFGPKNIKSI